MTRIHPKKTKIKTCKSFLSFTIDILFTIIVAMSISPHLLTEDRTYPQTHSSLFSTIFFTDAFSTRPFQICHLKSSTKVKTLMHNVITRTELSSTSNKSSFSSSDKAPKNNANNGKDKKVNNNKNNNNSSSSKKRSAKNNNKRKRKTRTKYEKEREELMKTRQNKYEEIRRETRRSPSLWKFEALFPEPVWDNESVYKDLYEVAAKNRDVSERKKMREEERKSREAVVTTATTEEEKQQDQSVSVAAKNEDVKLNNTSSSTSGMENNTATADANQEQKPQVIDRPLTRMVEERVYGYRRVVQETNGRVKSEWDYDTSLMGDGAVQFREGRRLGNPLKVNVDTLSYHAKREFSLGHFEESRELYEKCIEIDPRDGRGYLGLSRIYSRRRDFKTAGEILRAGINNSVDPDSNLPKTGSNAYLLQALGVLEERIGHLSRAEELYIQATKAKPYHAAAWVALAQLRTKKLGKGAYSGRVCFQTAERELEIAGKPPSSHVYTAWAALEYKNGNDHKRARELFRKALEIDPKCSAAYLQLGVLEAGRENWDKAKDCFETVLKFDQKNSRVLQAYALMESKRPYGDSRNVIDLFERALQARPRDAGVLQAYGLYVAKLGDIDTARILLKRATEVDKKHAPAWQAWGVLETKFGTVAAARDIFQQGIWACAQSAGGQSGGRRCARLWQAWGVLESSIGGDTSAARRCFARALDADNLNIASVTAWASMEYNLGNFKDARSIYERALRRFSARSDDKGILWRAYETMELRSGNLDEAQAVYQRSIRDSMSVREDFSQQPLNLDEIQRPSSSSTFSRDNYEQELSRKEREQKRKSSNEVEVVTWKKKRRDFNEGEVWINNGSIEGKVPFSKMNQKKSSNNK